MANNAFSVSGNKEQLAAFLKSTIASCNEVIGHYEFVLNDISSNISNSRLEAAKGPTVAFLTDMLAEWTSFRDSIQRDLDAIG